MTVNSKIVALLLLATDVNAFHPPINPQLALRRSSRSYCRNILKQEPAALFSTPPDSLKDEPSLLNNPVENDSDSDNDALAATNTINERLLSELEEATKKEKYGSRSSMGKKLGLESFKSDKTDEEREAAIAAARDLNGVNPVVALSGSLFALAVAAGLWTMTNYLAEYFALHPVESDVYFVQRVAGVFRNIVMGIASLASGFFGVTGIGIFLLGCRVAYGVAKGELDPTPIKSNKAQVEAPKMGNVIDLMLNKKPNRRGGRNDNDSNPFGI